MNDRKPRRLKHFPDAAGLDEAGRGPLAGPVVAAAVILPKGFRYVGIDDSKKLDARRRAELEIRIRAKAVYAVEVAEVDEIDRINILWASMAAMRRAFEKLGRDVPVYIDGNIVPPGLCGTAVIDGDAKIVCIAAASILAKTARDRIMTAYAEIYPEYGFERHFGYSTPEHMQALEKFGPCPIHRRSFAPCRIDPQPCLIFDE
ncbi:MAG TPA: ribonuclease HII [Fimbriimonadaceae bacterium]|nr:ribonuclease HII [Fimbriimonadaceae bacterium]